jgi:uncharacterized 2Fe-2S/4Fe-4S cluster protein (DUF4445 family)
MTYQPRFMATAIGSMPFDNADLAHIYIGGGFGRYLDIEQAKVIGLVPDLLGRNMLPTRWGTDATAP